MTIPSPAIIYHDTQIVTDANPAACELFRCDREWLIDRRLIDLVDDPNDTGLRALVKMRMALLRERGELPEWELPLMRFDGSIMWARVVSKRDDSAAEPVYFTRLHYIHEY